MYDFVFFNGFANDRNPIFWDISIHALVINDKINNLRSEYTLDHYCICINWACVNAAFDDIILSDSQLWDRRKPFNRQVVLDFIASHAAWD